MTVIGQSVVEGRRYSGFADPRFPIGYWQAALALTGDATGGSLVIDLLFQTALAGFLNSQMYSLERFSIHSTEGSQRTVRIGTVNMGGPSTQPFSHRYGVALLLISDEGILALEGESAVLTPMFLGSPQNAGISASLSVFTQNVNTITVTFEAEGYRWSPRSVLVDGGPQRPPTGLYAR